MIPQVYQDVRIDAFNYDPYISNDGTCILDGCPGTCFDDLSCNYWVYISNGLGVEYTHIL